MKESPVIKLSESEEMYLISIANIIENDGVETVPLSHLAEMLNIHAVSANQMIRKLEDEGLVNYFPYKGVMLSELGLRIALQMIRNRRLWEVFLVTHLDVPLDDAADIACGMEHITNGEVCMQLAKFLEYPKFDPYGKPIPECLEGKNILPQIKVFPLSETQLNDQLIIRQIKSDVATRAFLAAEGIYPGAEVKVAGIGEHGSYLLTLKQGRFHVNSSVAAQIMVRKNNEQPVELEQ